MGHKCTATTKKGKTCQAWAMRGHPNKVCHKHNTTGYKSPKVCRCQAYKWPHRPGGGLCLWPLPPIFTSSTPEGTKSPDHEKVHNRQYRGKKRRHRPRGWRAAAAYLETVHPEQWGEKRWYSHFRRFILVKKR